MDVWQIALYGGALLAAAKSLAALCTYHKRRFQWELEQQAEQARQAEQQRLKAEQEAAKAKARKAKREKGTAA